MTANAPNVGVTPGQIVAAREYIRRIGGMGYVDPEVVETANLPLDEIQESYRNGPIRRDHIQAARLLIELRGGEEFVDPITVAIAHARVPSAAGK